MSYYVSKKSKLLKEFDKTAGLMRDYLVRRYGEELAGRLYREVKIEFLPRLRKCRKLLKE